MQHEATTTPHLVGDLLAIIQQGMDLIAALDNDTYQAKPQVFASSSIGAHYRHHLEHIQLLLDGAQHTIDYDRRQRDPRVETDVHFAIERTKEVVTRLRQLTQEDLNAPVTVVHQSCMEEIQRPDCSSTLGRELLFVLSHAVHHYALMGIINQVIGKAPCDESFGIMPSTLSYLKAQGAQ